ncbi:hypothetical protein SLH46_15690 [Draconibacterium sp. IB214405]|uniref:hypothetical protein n=1 Tax=Draconibacterium sp. IB214405 TaxID=3097352 RepID=UPI002A0EF4B2|nr:hypothetical protein [Draconibacterium sp. IB214405]MDX8340640.1 hypothetical protein [Draconibacterium sp. IB214405]
MKKYLLSTLFVFSLIFTVQQLNACEIEISIEGDKKETYAAGEEIIIKVDVVFTHRVCPEGIENTKFKYDGLKVLGATKWKEYETGKFERKLKIKVLEGEQKEIILEAIRSCDKEGGYGKISLTRHSVA